MATIMRTTATAHPKSLRALIHGLSRVPNLLFIGLIRFYKAALSPLMVPSCRFYPSCSQYGLEAFKKYNVFKALGLTIWRVLRCNPFNRGGYDPLP